MSEINIRLYYKNQLDLGYSLKDIIDSYFDNKISNLELEENIKAVVNANKDKFFKDNEIAPKPKQILGKTRLQLLTNILNKNV